MNPFAFRWVTGRSQRSPQGKSILSIEIKVSYLAAVGTLDSVVTATGSVDKVGTGIGVVSASAIDSKGRIRATATSWVMIVDLG